jgi:hypothetical protein
MLRFQELDEKGAYDKPCDGFAVFNSSQQLKMLLSVKTDFMTGTSFLC